MIEYKRWETDGEQELVLQCTGLVVELAADINYLVGHIYSQIKAMDPLGAEVFRSACRAGLRDGSPTWKIDASKYDAIRFQSKRKKEG